MMISRNTVPYFKILRYQKSLKNDQQPKTMLDATRVIINHRYNNANQMKHHKKGQGQKK